MRSRQIEAEKLKEKIEINKMVRDQAAIRRSVAKNSIEYQKQQQHNLVQGLKHEGKAEINNNGFEEIELKMQRAIEVKQMHRNKKIKDQMEIQQRSKSTSV